MGLVFWVLVGVCCLGSGFAYDGGVCRVLWVAWFGVVCLRGVVVVCCFGVVRVWWVAFGLVFAYCRFWIAGVFGFWVVGCGCWWVRAVWQWFC